jgi:hypothetical protein
MGLVIKLFLACAICSLYALYSFEVKKTLLKKKKNRIIRVVSGSGRRINLNPTHQTVLPTLTYALAFAVSLLSGCARHFMVVVCVAHSMEMCKVRW